MTEKELLEARRVARLIAGFIAGNLTKQDTETLDEWIAESDENMLLFEKLTDENNIEWAMAWFKQLDIRAALEQVEMSIQRNKTQNRKRVLTMLAAACLLLIAGTIVFKTLQPTKNQSSTATLSPVAVHPGSKKALLMSEGHTFNLESLQEQIIPVGAGGASNSHNILSYEGRNQSDIVANTLLVPSGGEYQVVLADGTKVWLNAASQLRYPSVFAGNRREVELEGEAYFEVAHDASKPFVVLATGTTITVKGTHFNVQAYPDATSQTVSLLQGAVEVTRNNRTKLLTPDHQMIITRDSLRIESTAEIAESIAWTKGLFSFHKNSVREVMQQISRWYKVSVRYEGNLEKTFTGQIYRSSSLRDVLEMLDSTEEVQFTLEDSVVIVNARR